MVGQTWHKKKPAATLNLVCGEICIILFEGWKNNLSFIPNKFHLLNENAIINT
jgi:hypothetical protein